MLQLLSFLLRTGRSMVVVAVVAALVSGVATVVLLRTVTLALAEHRSHPLAFAVLAATALMTSALAQLLLHRIATLSLLQLRTLLCHRILLLPLAQVERLGPSRLLAALTEDAPVLVQALGMLPLTLSNLVTIVAANAYLALLSPQAFVGWLAFIGVAGFTLHPLIGFTRKLEGQTRAEVSVLYTMYRGLVDGNKELKLDRDLRERFLGRVEASASKVRRLAVGCHDAAVVALSWSRLLVFACIALALYQASIVFSPMVVQTYVFTIIFLIAPLESLVGYFPAANRGRVAIDALSSVGLELEQIAPDATDSAPPQRELEAIELSDVRYTYTGDGQGESFTLGPVSLRVAKGKILFIVGGNGSGKTTLAKVLVGLYPAQSGELVLDDRVVTEANRDWYRQHFTAIFNDYYLFDHVRHLNPAELARVVEYLAALGLSQKVEATERGVLVTSALSTGQRKRLAMLMAYLADRPVCVLDEWAADQDPAFKRVFYTQILQDLRSRGKAVVVISHDERYFHVADELVKLEQGCRTDDSTAQFMTRLVGDK